MVDLRILNRRSITSDKLKSLFAGKKVSDPVESLRRRMWGRAQDGIQRNCEDYKLWYAIDQAWDTPLRQVSYTLLQTLANSDPSKDNVYKIFQQLDLTQFVRDDLDGKTGKKTGKKTLDLPTFFSVIVPIARAYGTIRWAKLTNDRWRNPFLRYDPLRNEPEERAKCEILTGRVQLMSTQMDYYEVFKQAALKTILYHTSLMFIDGEWYDESQLRLNQDGREEKTTIKEGLRYHLPHPTRQYRDRSYPPTWFNTDNGPRWGGYWRVKRFSEVANDPKLWNREKITIGRDWIATYPTYFTLVYPTVMKFPQSTQIHNNDEQERMADSWYSSDYEDCGILITEHFEKMIPKEIGFGDYEHPVWFRFLFGGDGTVLYACPLPATPILAWVDSGDDSRAVNASMALELIPWQDMVSNFITQMILTAKQNLANMTFVDGDVLKPGEIEKLENAGEAFYRKRNYVAFSGKDFRARQLQPDESFFPVSFPHLDVNGIVNSLNVILGIMERVLQISAQEVGAAASHEQTSQEIGMISSQVSTRVKFAGNPIDRTIDAWKRQLYAYLQAYGEEELYAQLPASTPVTKEQLEKLGFTVEEHPMPGETKYSVKGSKTAIQIEYFASSSEGDDRTNNVALAGAMSQVLQAALNNQMVATAMGPDEAIKLLNQIFKTMGLPEDFKLRNTAPAGANPGSPEFLQAIQQQVVQLIQQSTEATKKEVEGVVVPMAKLVNEIRKQTESNTGAIQKIVEIIGQAPPTVPPTAYDSMSPEAMATSAVPAGAGLVEPGPGPGLPPGPPM